MEEPDAWIVHIVYRREGEIFSEMRELPPLIHLQDPIRIQQALLSIVSRMIPDMAEKISEVGYAEGTGRNMEVKA